MTRLAVAAAAAGLLAASATRTSPVNVDVSRAPGTQSEVSIAADPRHPDVLLAGSNDYALPTTRVYSSADGGQRWTSQPGPPLVNGLPGTASDPVVGIDARGRQYFGFIQVTEGSDESHGRSWLVVASRPTRHGFWRSRPVPGADGADKPALAVSGNRVYVAWVREGDWLRPRRPLNDVLLSSSTDGGRTWSRPVQLNSIDSLFLSYPSIAVSGGTVYATWLDEGLVKLRSGDSRRFGAEQTIGAPGGSGCPTGIPAQPRHCLRPNPVVVADPVRKRVYATWSQLARNHSVDIEVIRIGGSPRQVNPPDGAVVSDQFWPAPAVDARTGDLWVCFYDTRDDPRRRASRFSCTVSSDGGTTWAQPLPVASAATDGTKSHYRRPYGDYEGLVVAGGVAHPIWTDGRGLPSRAAEIYTARLATAQVQERAGRYVSAEKSGRTNSSNVSRSQLATTDGVRARIEAVRGMSIVRATSPK